jgi:hypothetical protein
MRIVAKIGHRAMSMSGVAIGWCLGFAGETIPNEIASTEKPTPHRK